MLNLDEILSDVVVDADGTELRFKAIPQVESLRFLSLFQQIKSLDAIADNEALLYEAMPDRLDAIRDYVAARMISAGPVICNGQESTITDTSQLALIIKHYDTETINKICGALMERITGGRNFPKS